jgi:hypothetical protein
LEEKTITFPVTVSGLYRIYIKNTILVHVPNLTFTINVKCGRETDFKEVIYASQEWTSRGIVIQNLTEHDRTQNEYNDENSDKAWSRTISITLKSHSVLGIKQVPFRIKICSEYEKIFFEQGGISEDETRMIDCKIPRGIYKIFASSEIKGQNLHVEISSDLYSHVEPSLKKGLYSTIQSPYIVTWKELTVRFTIHAKAFLKNKPGLYCVVIGRSNDWENEINRCQELNDMAKQILEATDKKDGDKMRDILFNRWKPYTYKTFQSPFVQHDMEKVMHAAELLSNELMTLIRDATEIIPDNPLGDGDFEKITEMKTRIDNFFIHSEELVDISKRAKRFLKLQLIKTEIRSQMTACLESLSNIFLNQNFSTCTDSSILPERLEQVQDIIAAAMKRFGNDADAQMQRDLRTAKRLAILLENQIKLQSQMDSLLKTENPSLIQPFLLRNQQFLAVDAYNRGKQRADELVQQLESQKLEQLLTEPIVESSEETPSPEYSTPVLPTKREKTIFEKQLVIALAAKKKKLQESNQISASVYYHSPEMVSSTESPTSSDDLPSSHEQLTKTLHYRLVDLMKLASQFVDRTQNGKLIVYFEYPFADLIGVIVRVITSMLIKDRLTRKKEKKLFEKLKKQTADSIEYEIIPVKDVIRGLSSDGSGLVKDFEKLSELKQVQNQAPDIVEFNVASLLVQYALHMDLLSTLLAQLTCVKSYRQSVYLPSSIFNAYDSDTLTAVFGLLDSLKFTFEYFNRDSNLEKFFSRVKKINVVDASEVIALDPTQKVQMKTNTAISNRIVNLLKRLQECIKSILRYFLQYKTTTMVSIN